MKFRVNFTPEILAHFLLNNLEQLTFDSRGWAPVAFCNCTSFVTLDQQNHEYISMAKDISDIFMHLQNISK